MTKCQALNKTLKRCSLRHSRTGWTGCKSRKIGKVAGNAPFGKWQSHCNHDLRAGLVALFGSGPVNSPSQTGKFTGPYPSLVNYWLMMERGHHWLHWCTPGKLRRLWWTVQNQWPHRQPLLPQWYIRQKSKDFMNVRKGLARGQIDSGETERDDIGVINVSNCQRRKLIIINNYYEEKKRMENI